MPLTERQRQILDHLRDQQRLTGLTPSTREIQRHFRFASQTAVMNHLRALERKGEIRRLPGKARAILLPPSSRPSLAQIPILGCIPAGPASLQDQQAEGCLSVDLDSVGLQKNARTFALRVRGDSMTDAHILDGDIVVLEFRDPLPGDVVAALIDGETTLKRYLVNRGKPFLKAENPRYPNLIPAAELVIQGVMIALVRKIDHDHKIERRR